MTEAELVGADYIMPQMIWTRNFLMSQGWFVQRNLLYQDNKSAMQLERNRARSNSRRTRHLNIKFYFIMDRIESGEITIKYRPIDDMVGDFFTKPLQGHKFWKFRKTIMGRKDEPGPQECVEGDKK